MSETQEQEQEQKPLTMGEKLGLATVIVLFLICAVGIAWNVGTWAVKKWRYDPWQIVCSPDGFYSFTDEDGDVRAFSYKTEAEAEQSMESWFDFYIHRNDPNPEREAAKRRKWRACK